MLKGEAIMIAVLVGSGTTIATVALIGLIWRVLVRVAQLRRQADDAVAQAVRQGREMAAQNGLEQNLDMLRMSLYGLGEPRVEAGALWFGTHRVNGDSGLVDAVKAKFGGAATIFLGDQRIATNVQKADGSRALGTRLTPGPAYERVLRQGLSYRGETEILGVSYLALYEPISRDGVVIGLLFAGVQKVNAMTEKPKPASARGIGGLAAIRAAIEALQRIAHEQSDEATRAITQRQAADDARRRLDAERQKAAREQELAIAALAEGLEHLASGDLIFRLTETLAVEYEALRADFNAAIATMHETMQAITMVAQGVRSGAEEITQASDDLSHRTEQQAASLEETAAALDQITATVRKTAEGATEARNVVDGREGGCGALRRRGARGRQRDGRDREIVQADRQHHRRDRRDRLPDQSAGAERRRRSGAGGRCRARLRRGRDRGAGTGAAFGQCGQGDQDADLGLDAAGRCRRAAGRRDRQGAGADRRAGREAEHLVADIAASAQEQAAGLEQVNTAVNQMDQVTQQNAAMVEQATAASHNLSDEAEDLARLVGQFQIGPHTGSPTFGQAAPKTPPKPRITTPATGKVIVLPRREVTPRPSRSLRSVPEPHR